MDGRVLAVQQLREKLQAPHKQNQVYGVVLNSSTAALVRDSRLPLSADGITSGGTATLIPVCSAPRSIAALRGCASRRRCGALHVGHRPSIVCLLVQNLISGDVPAS